MTPAQVAHVQSTADVFLSIGDQIADRFYIRVFELAPEARALFPEDLRRQKVKLVDTIATLVAHISHQGAFDGYLARLGRHHSGLGVLAKHYSSVATALLDSLREVLGERFTPDVEMAWTALYGVIAERMITGARGTEAVRTSGDLDLL